MCGIAGWLSNGPPIDQTILRTMTDALSHRGPDAAGLSIDGAVGFGHRRLSVIDLSESANQPMDDHEGLVLMVFNGEIYNYRELRRRLAELGHRFRTNSDSEVILEAYKRYGRACVAELNGMFAFAIWDRPRRELFLARDRAGEKPLFYALTDAGFLFASELGALRLHPAVRGDIDPSGLAKYLTHGYVTGEGTLLADVRRLPAGCTLTITQGGRPLVQRYWSLAEHYNAPHGLRDDREAAEQLTALIDDATRLRMVADVPIGAFLSSGVDSSTIVAAMTRSAADVRTFSIGFDASGYDESSDARNTAAALGTRHAEQRIDLDLAAMIQGIGRAADEPLADNSTVPTWLLCRFAREQVTVALSGDGGDELFGGYETYLADRLARPLARFPSAFWKGAADWADRALPVSFGKVGWDFKARQFLAGLARGWPAAHFGWRTLFDDGGRARLLGGRHADAMAWGDPYEDFATAYAATSGADDLDRAMHVDTATWMVDDVLVKVDRMSMAHALEVRAPFLDHRVMEFAAALPPAWKIRNRRTKHILKESQKGRLPGEVLVRRKLGFNAPMSHWLLGPLRDYAEAQLFSGILDNLFDRAEIARLWNEHKLRRSDNGFRIFALLLLTAWFQKGQTNASARHGVLLPKAVVGH